MAGRTGVRTAAIVLLAIVSTAVSMPVSASVIFSTQHKDECPMHKGSPVSPSPVKHNSPVTISYSSGNLRVRAMAQPFGCNTPRNSMVQSLIPSKLPLAFPAVKRRDLPDRHCASSFPFHSQISVSLQRLARPLDF